MMEDYFEIDWKKIKDELKSKNINTLFIELPEGLKQFIPEIDEKLKNFCLIYSGENVYGSCDTDIFIKTNGILHFGHAPIPNLKYRENTFFAELKRKIEINENLLKSILDLKCKNIGLLATVQYISLLDSLSDLLRHYDIKVYISKGDDRLFYPGQVLGCDFSSAEKIKDLVDCFLVLADGTFHANGIFMSTNKNTYAAEPITGKISKIENDRFLRERYLQMERARSAMKIGILVSTKIGQYRINIAKKIKDEIIKNGKKGYIVVLNEITSNKLQNLNFDAFVNTACPRITLDDVSLYDKPILTPMEMEMALGIIPNNNYIIDRINYVDNIGKIL
ncbi:MAG: diphthamide biosynthesis enzyme Dph2 [Thermoplasmata archaeon]